MNMAKDEDKKAKSDEDLLADAMKAFTRAEDREQTNRENWVKDVRFGRLGEQWPDAVRAQREKDGRPCLTINKMPAVIRQVTNDARQNSPSIKFHPVGDGADQATARIYDGLTRNIEYTSNADVAYDNALDNAVCGGFGYFLIDVDYASDDAFDMDILIKPVKNPLTVYGDPLSTCADSSDWDEAFVITNYSKAQFKKKWPKAEKSSFEAGDYRTPGWLSEDEVRVAEWWTREDVEAELLLLSNGAVMLREQYDAHPDLFEVQGITISKTRPTTTKKVTQRIITGAEILETNAWAGKYIPIVPIYGDEVMVENERHFLSLIRFARDPQQMFNYWRTASTELVALAPKAPWVGPAGAFASDPGWATANTENHQYLEYDGEVAPQRQPFAGVPAGALQEAMNAADDIKSVTGLHDASMGAQSNETSGRAIIARQREGDVSTFNFIDNLSRGIGHAGRIIGDLIPKVYSKARVIRVINEDGSNKNVAINGATPPPPTPEELAKQQEENAAIAQAFDLTAGKYDVTSVSGPSYTTKREEAANQMIEFMRAVPGAAQYIGDLLAKNLDWPGAEEIAARLRLMLPPQLQGQNPQAQQMQQQIQQLVQALEQSRKQLEEAQRDKSIEVDKLKIDDYKAHTDRIKALGVTLAPEAAAAMGLQVAQSAAQVLATTDETPGAPAPQQQMPMQPPPEQAPQNIQPQPPDGGFFTPEGNQ